MCIYVIIISVNVCWHGTSRGFSATTQLLNKSLTQMLVKINAHPQR